MKFQRTRNFRGNVVIYTDHIDHCFTKDHKRSPMIAYKMEPNDYVKSCFNSIAM